MPQMLNRVVIINYATSVKTVRLFIIFPIAFFGGGGVGGGGGGDILVSPCLSVSLCPPVGRLFSITFTIKDIDRNHCIPLVTVPHY